jgi:hypothetical protein
MEVAALVRLGGKPMDGIEVKRAYPKEGGTVAIYRASRDRGAAYPSFSLFFRFKLRRRNEKS